MAWPLGPPDGRYVLRGHAGTPTHVLVVATLGAHQRRLGLPGRKRRPRGAAPSPEPTPVATGRATLVAAEPFPDEAAARAWHEGVDAERELDAALTALEPVLHAHRLATMDPDVPAVRRERLLVARVGWGDGDQVADGRWREAVELPPHEPTRAEERRLSALAPHERLAAILAGRDVALAAEVLALRARADLDAGRSREAALGLRVAFEAALAELVPWADRGDLGSRLTALHELRGTVGEAANAALRGGLDEPTLDAVAQVLEALEAALRRRTAVADLG